MDTQQWIDKGYNIIVEFTPKLLAAILIWIIGSWIIKLTLKGLKKILNKGDYDESLKKFSLSLLTWIFKIVLILVVLGTVLWVFPRFPWSRSMPPPPRKTRR